MLPPEPPSQQCEAAGASGRSRRCFPQSTMDAQQRQHFSKHGYLVLNDAIPPALVAALNLIYDQKVEDEVLPARQAWEAEHPNLPFVWHGFQKDFQAGLGKRMWSEAYYELVDPPKVVAILAELLSDPTFEHAPDGDAGSPKELARRFRLDHDNIHFTPPFEPGLDIVYDREKMPKEYWSPSGLVRGGIHGGQPGVSTAPADALRYNTDVSRMITCVYELLPSVPGTAGTVIIVSFGTPSRCTASPIHSYRKSSDDSVMASIHAAGISSRDNTAAGDGD